MDEYIDIKDKLTSYRYYKEEMDVLKLQIDEMESRLTTANSTSIIQMDDGNGIKKYLNDYASELADMKAEWERRYIESVKKWKEVQDLINLLQDPLEKIVLFAYYCSADRKTLSKIARERHYSLDHVKRKHSLGIQHLKELSNKKERVG